MKSYCNCDEASRRGLKDILYLAINH